MRHPPSTSAFRISFGTFASLWPVVVLALLVALVGKVASPGSGSLSFRGLAEVGLVILVAFSAYNHILSDGERSGLKALLPKRPTALILFIALSSLGLAAMRYFSRAHELTPDSVSSGIALTLVLFAASLLMVAKFGTIFPAVVDGGDPSLRAASRRGQVWSVVWRLVGFLVLSFAIQTGSLMVGMKILHHGEYGVPAVVATGLVSMFTLFYLVTLLATLFSKAYLGSYSKTGENHARWLDDIFA